MLAAAVLIMAAVLPATAPSEHVVEIRGLEFHPDRLEAAAGDTIIWINRDFVPHTVTADDETWDSGEIATGAEWRMTVGENTSGPYYCRFHPMMTARFALRTK